jgi:glycosyltransferase involved in cell wall biosynthesis
LNVQIIIPPEREGVSFREVGFTIAQALKRIRPTLNVAVDPWTRVFVPNVKLTSPLEFNTWDLFIFPMTVAPNATTLFATYANPLYSKRAWYYGVIEGKTLGLNDLMKAYLRRRVVTPSNFSKQMLEESGIEVKDVIPHGFIPEQYGFKGDLVRSIIERFKGKILLYYLSSGIRRKGITPLIEAMSIVAKKHPEALLYLDVLPQFMEEHWRTVQKFKLQQNVVVEGNFGSMSKDQVVAKYHACDLYVHGAFSEGFGIPLVEASLCGKPSVCVDASPMNEHIDKNCGWLVPYDHVEWENYLGIVDIKEHVFKPEAFAEAIIDALDHPEEIKEKGVKAYEKALHKYNYLATYKRFLELE